MSMLILTAIFGACAWIALGWAGLLVFVLALIWGGVMTMYAGYTRDAIRPQAEWSEKPVPHKDWVL